MRLATGHALSACHQRYPPLTSAMPSSALLSTSGRLAAAPCTVLLAGLHFASAPDRCSQQHYAADISELAPCFARSQRAPTRVSLLSSARHLVPLEHSTPPCARLSARHFRRRLPLRANAAMLCDVQHVDRLVSMRFCPAYRRRRRLMYRPSHSCTVFRPHLVLSPTRSQPARPSSMRSMFPYSQRTSSRHETNFKVLNGLVSNLNGLIYLPAIQFPGNPFILHLLTQLKP